MAEKTIPEFPEISEISDSNQFIVDSGIQTFRSPFSKMKQNLYNTWFQDLEEGSPHNGNRFLVKHGTNNESVYLRMQDLLEYLQVRITPQWQTWSPSVPTGLTLQSARFCQMLETVFWEIGYTGQGSVSSNFTFGLPLTIASNYPSICFVGQGAWNNNSFSFQNAVAQGNAGSASITVLANKGDNVLNILNNTDLNGVNAGLKLWGMYRAEF